VDDVGNADAVSLVFTALPSAAGSVIESEDSLA
jgi:hypothetical protein